MNNKENNKELNRKIINDIIDTNMNIYTNVISKTDLDMWLVTIVYKNAFNNLLEEDTAYFTYRHEAEKWLSNKTTLSNGNKKSYYAFCCDSYIWYNIDDLLS